MPATKAILSRWFDEGIEDHDATHMIVKCDPFEYQGNQHDMCCYPIYVTKDGEDSVRLAAHDGPDRLMEVYDLRMDKDEQINDTKRVFNY